MTRLPHHARVALATVLTVVLVLAVAALAGASPGKGKPGKPGKKDAPSTAQYQYGPSGKQYGKTKVTLCHKGKKTITVGAPAAKAHMRHGDKLGRCP
jgi:hypothetical protein